MLFQGEASGTPHSFGSDLFAEDSGWLVSTKSAASPTRHDSFPGGLRYSGQYNGRLGYPPSPPKSPAKTPTARTPTSPVKLMR